MFHAGSKDWPFEAAPGWKGDKPKSSQYSLKLAANEFNRHENHFLLLFLVGNCFSALRPGACDQPVHVRSAPPGGHLIPVCQTAVPDVF